LRHHSPTGWSRAAAAEHTLWQTDIHVGATMGEKKHDFFFSLFAIMCVRACIDAFYHFYQPPPTTPEPTMPIAPGLSEQIS